MAAASQPAASTPGGDVQMPSVPEASAAQQGAVADAGPAAEASAKRSRRGNGFHSRTASLFGEEFPVSEFPAPQTPMAAGVKPPTETPASPLAGAQLHLQQRPIQPGEQPGGQQLAGQQPVGQPDGRYPADIVVYRPYPPAAAAAVPGDAGRCVSAPAAEAQPAAGTEATAQQEPGGTIAAVRTAQEGAATSSAAQQAADSAARPAQGPAKEEKTGLRSQDSGSPGKRRKSRSQSRLELPPWEP